MTAIAVIGWGLAVTTWIGWGVQSRLTQQAIDEWTKQDELCKDLIKRLTDADQ